MFCSNWRGKKVSINTPNLNNCGCITQSDLTVLLEHPDLLLQDLAKNRGSPCPPAPPPMIHNTNLLKHWKCDDGCIYPCSGNSECIKRLEWRVKNLIHAQMPHIHTCCHCGFLKPITMNTVEKMTVQEAWKWQGRLMV